MYNNDGLLIVEKAPADAFYVLFDHSEFLTEIGSTTISASVWTVDPVDGLTLTEQTIPTTSTTQVKIAGGSRWTNPILTNVFTTADGQTKQRSVEVRIDIR
jgi:hypothetical protein